MRRMEQYAASLPLRKQGEERTPARLRQEGNAADDVLMVDQGHRAQCFACPTLFDPELIRPGARVYGDYALFLR